MRRERRERRREDMGGGVDVDRGVYRIGGVVIG